MTPEITAYYMYSRWQGNQAQGRTEKKQGQRQGEFQTTQATNCEKQRWQLIANLAAKNEEPASNKNEFC
jgi:hypothetical protein